jgi:hypothetical protein
MLVREFPDWTPEQISDKTGIHSRHMAAAGEFTSDIAVKAAERLFAERAGLRREDIDFIMLMTVSPDYLLPFTAGIIQSRWASPRAPARWTARSAARATCTAWASRRRWRSPGARSGSCCSRATGSRPTRSRATGRSRRSWATPGTASLIEAVDEERPADPGRGGLVGATDYGTDGRAR